MKMAVVLFSMATAWVLYMNKGLVTSLIVGEKASKEEHHNTVEPPSTN